MKNILSLLVLLPIMVVGQTQTENYIKTTTYKVTTSTSIVSPSSTQATQNITYFDGLGRPIQSITKQGGGNQQDIITPIVYDGFGRQTKDFLPYTRTTSSLNFESSMLPNSNGDIIALNSYYTSRYPNDINATTPNPFSQKQFEPSPLNRVLQQAAPGKDWALANNHTIKLDYQINTDADFVRRFGVSFIGGNTENPYLEDQGVYAPYQLHKTITKDENWISNQTYSKDHTTEDYKDKEGRVVLKRTFDAGKWYDTYYVYDDYGNLTYVIPPKVFTYHSITQPFVGQSFHSDTDTDNLVFFMFNDYAEIFFRLNNENNIYLSLYAYGFTPGSALRNGKIADLNFTPDLPNMTLCNIMVADVNGNSVVGGTAYIQNGDLYFTPKPGVGVYPVSNGEMYFSTTINLSSFQANYTPPALDRSTLNDLIYQYRYDKRNRLVEKKLPGKEWEYIVYDKLDRPVLTQDANLRTSNKWLFTKYDAFSRPVYTGEYINTTAGQTSRTAVQGLVDLSTTMFETKQGENTINGTTVYYSNNAFPNINNANINLFIINYYDNYTFDLNGANTTGAYDATITNAKGLATGSKVRVLGTNNWITNANYYDAKGRSICSYSKNDYLTTTSKVNSKLDFVGKVQETTSTQDKTGQTTITIVDKFTYDQAGRVTKQTQAINGATTPEVITENSYAELGQFFKKEVGGKSTQSRLQTINYSYNIRGWLKGINDSDTSNSTITMGIGDLFGFQINYNDGPTDPLKKMYNGNISQTYWKTTNPIDTSLRNYNYSYDGLNRLTRAQYSLSTPDRYNENLTYDKNGNIMSLIRTGNTIANGSTFGTMDNLIYTYLGNRLNTVEDSSGSTEGFKNGSHTAQEYDYDDNGNMKRDDNKGITAIAYNHLNLPTDVTLGGGTIHYDYDATGVKQRKIAAGTTTDYAGRFQYEKTAINGTEVLKFFLTPEGYAENNNGIFSYIYQYKDHLGNVRLSYKDVSLTTTPSLQIVEETNYYPFGLKHKDNNVVNSTNPGQKYKYNGKELQDELGLNMYDYGARNYDPALGRWMNMDNMAEKYISLSPYHYAGNNPVVYLDVDGNEFTESAWVWVNRLIADINSRQASNNKTIEEAKQTIASGKFGWFQSEKSLNNKIARLNNENAGLETTRGETATLAASSQVYDVVTDSGGTEKDAIGNSTITNQTTFNSDNNRVQLSTSSGTDLGLFSHELKHMYQFETGETSLGLTKNKGGSNLIGGSLLFYDLSDEVQAYQRGALFGQRENINSTADVLTKGIYDSRIPSGPINAVNHPNAAGIKQNPQSFADKYNAAFRIGTTTYKPQ